MDFFTEYIVARKKTRRDYLNIVGIVLLALVVFYIGLIFAPYLQGIFLLFTLGVIYGAYFLIRRLNIEYEYIFTNGELDIDRIVAKRKRRRLITVQARQFEFFAPLSNPGVDDALKSGIQQTIHAEGDMESERVYIAVLTHKGIKTCLYIEPSERILEGLEKYVPRRSFFRS